jgi:SAM-dependent methyltransferase
VTETSETEQARRGPFAASPILETMQLTEAPPTPEAARGLDAFLLAGKTFVEYMIRFGLERHHRVLDIGCGGGRMAVAMTDYLTSDYEGFDVSDQGIRWCKRVITPRHRNFHFRHVRVANGLYRKEGESAASFRFPYANAAFDFAIAISVFTHLRPDEAARYLFETARVLRSGGTLFSTWFLLDDFSRERVENGHTRWLRHRYGDAMMVHDSTRPEVAIGFPQEWVEGTLRDTGFQVSEPWYGSWSGRSDSLDYQDIVLARRD